MLKLSGGTTCSASLLADAQKAKFKPHPEHDNPERCSA
jgi:hypothetical protein